MNKKFKSLKNIRSSLKLTQFDVAKKSGITESYYNLIENGNRKPSMEIAFNICTVLNITLDDFFAFLNFTKCEEIS